MRSIVITSLLLIGTWLSAQSYRPLLDTSATWQDNLIDDDPFWTFHFHCYEYYLRGDTLLNDTAYKILRKNGYYGWSSNNFPYPSGEEWFSGSVVAYVREDTVAHKVFGRDDFWPYERLWYDFSVGIGAYPSTYASPWPTMQVTSVDTIILSDGPHRRLTLDPSTHLVEGIGFDHGFLPIYYFNYGGLVCHTTTGAANYEYYNSLDCACGSNVSVPTHAESTFRVGPSPTSGLCYLEGASPSAIYRIRSMDGRIAHTGLCSSNGSTTIDMTGLPAAMYLVEVMDTAGSRTARIVKE